LQWLSRPVVVRTVFQGPDSPSSSPQMDTAGRMVEQQTGPNSHIERLFWSSGKRIGQVWASISPLKVYWWYWACGQHRQPHSFWRFKAAVTENNFRSISRDAVKQKRDESCVAVFDMIDGWLITQRGLRHRGRRGGFDFSPCLQPQTPAFSPSLQLLLVVISERGYSWWEVGKVEPGPELFFLMPASAQLSAYANHEFKIIPTPTQLSAYANHELKNWYYLAKVTRRQTARAKYWSRAYAQLERNITYIMNLLCSKTSEDSSTYA